MAAIADAGRGVIVYLRGQEARGIGIASKLQAYELQDSGHDTVDANLHLGLPVDSREYSTAAKVLLELGVERMRLITNNPAKCADLGAYGIEISERVALPARPTPKNITYLETKRRRMGHLLGGLETSVGIRVVHERPGNELRCNDYRGGGRAPPPRLGGVPRRHRPLGQRRDGDHRRP